MSRRKPQTEEQMAVTEHAVTVVGGGPAGMMLAAELTLAGVDVGLLRADLI
jgi:NADPH-dependent 2,4-dienoyl-CoA reductase/sulfur reductase-like enzyme